MFKVAVCLKTLYPGSTIGFSTPFKPTPQSHNPDGYLGITHPVHAVIPKSSPPNLAPWEKVAPPLPSSPVP